MSVISASGAKGKVLRTFTPVETFQNGQDVYVSGLYYSIREGNERLASLVQGWLEQGKVKLVKKRLHIIGGE